MIGRAQLARWRSSTAAGLFNVMLYGGSSIGPALAGGLSPVSVPLAFSDTGESGFWRRLFGSRSS
jgi:hypothetical protein